MDGFLNDTIQGVLWALFGIATVTDLLKGKIYNTLTFSFLVAGLCARVFSQGAAGGQQACLSLLVAFALYFPLWRLKVLAAGDVKLLLAAAPWLSYPQTIRLAFLTILVGAAVGGVIRGIRAIREKDNKTLMRMPLAPAFFCAFVLMQIAVMKHWGNWPW